MEHEMKMKDFNWHKSNGEIASAMTVDEINLFKYKKGNGHRAYFKGAQGKTCSKCSMSHLLRECPAWGKKCHKCENKKHFSTCCRSRQKGSQTSKRPHHGRSIKRCPKCRCRSRSNTWSAHSIELSSFQDHPQLHGRLSSNVYERLANHLHGRHSFQDPEESTNILSKTFHSIYRSKSMLSISNETDPDGKTKILTIVRLKLPHWNVIDNMWVKVADSEEASILPLDSFRTMFHHALDENGYPQNRIPGEIQGQTWMLWWWEADKPWLHQAKTSALLRKILSRPYILCYRNQDSKRDHCRTPSECQIRSHSCGMRECIQVHFNHRKQWECQLQQLLSRPLTKYWQKTMTEKAEK